MEATGTKTLEQVEREYIEAVLSSHLGNRTHAAKALGISIRTLQRKLRSWERTDQLRQHFRPATACR
jgi:transcriptional regulator with PAS, ATPase and Fis domain